MDIEEAEEFYWKLVEMRSSAPAVTGMFSNREYRDLNGNPVTFVTHTSQNMADISGVEIAGEDWSVAFSVMPCGNVYALRVENPEAVDRIRVLIALTA